jgi:hypothetical protein
MKLTASEKDAIARRALMAVNRLKASNIQTAVDEQSIRRWLKLERELNVAATLHDCPAAER